MDAPEPSPQPNQPAPVPAFARQIGAEASPGGTRGADESALDFLRKAGYFALQSTLAR